MTYILLHISAIYHALHSIMGKKNILLKYETPCLNTVHIQTKIYFLTILHISLQIKHNLNLKIREDRNHYCHISSVHKSYLYNYYSRDKPFQLLSKNISGVLQISKFFVCNFLQTKSLLEEMLNLFHNNLTKN